MEHLTVLQVSVQAEFFRNLSVLTSKYYSSEVQHPDLFLTKYVCSGYKLQLKELFLHHPVQLHNHQEIL